MSYNSDAFMASRIKGRIAEVATDLFADRGYHGVSTRDVAKEAKVTEASIYRLFTTKDGLFKEVLSAALGGALDPAQFLFMIYESERKQEIRPLLTAAILRWYLSLSIPAARLLTQAYFMPEWRDFAYGSINKIMEILATTLERHSNTNDGQKIDYITAGRAPILALLQFKITYAKSCSAKEEKIAVTALIQQWLRGVLATT
jgi:AcrR family transcriptional regulator